MPQGERKNQINEQQLDFFTDRTSAAIMACRQLPPWVSSFANVLMTALRRFGLRHTELETATCGTIRLKLLKIGARAGEICGLGIPQCLGDRFSCVHNEYADLAVAALDQIDVRRRHTNRCDGLSVR